MRIFICPSSHSEGRRFIIARLQDYTLPYSGAEQPLLGNNEGSSGDITPTGTLATFPQSKTGVAWSHRVRRTRQGTG
jgi:hypothetical protein